MPKGKDNINPSHYKQGNVEVIEMTETMGFLEGNIVKYVARHEFKNGLEDLKKAKWYLDRLIANTEKESKEWVTIKEEDIKKRNEEINEEVNKSWTERIQKERRKGGIVTPMPFMYPTISENWGPPYTVTCSGDNTPGSGSDSSGGESEES